MKNDQTRSCLLATLVLAVGCSGTCGQAKENPVPSENSPPDEPTPRNVSPVEKPQANTNADTGGDVVIAELVSFAFDDDEVGTVPKSIELKETAGRGTPAVWKVVADESAPSKPGAFGTVETKNKGRTYNVALVTASSLKDVEISLRVKSVKGKEDQGGGPIWRAADADNYYIARWNPLEDNFRIYYVKGGERDQIASVKIRLSPKKWYDMKIIMKGKHIEGWLDGEKKLEVDDETFGEAGMVGLWTKADAETLFDDFVARPVATE
ncbi:MAG: DUF1080 domain-containing protein [Deltaproteobacteria bacterium]|nr:DUF1080 domain-containing protein [Deltaproteobacteria bacterium]